MTISQLEADTKRSRDQQPPPNSRAPQGRAPAVPWSSKPYSMLAPSPIEQMEVTQFLSCSFSQADPHRQTESCNFTLRTRSDACWSLGEQTDPCQAVLHYTAIGSRDLQYVRIATGCSSPASVTAFLCRNGGIFIQPQDYGLPALFNILISVPSTAGSRVSSAVGG